MNPLEMHQNTIMKIFSYIHLFAVFVYQTYSWEGSQNISPQNSKNIPSWGVQNQKQIPWRKVLLGGGRCAASPRANSKRGKGAGLPQQMQNLNPGMDPKSAPRRGGCWVVGLELVGWWLNHQPI